MRHLQSWEQSAIYGKQKRKREKQQQDKLSQEFRNETAESTVLGQDLPQSDCNKGGTNIPGNSEMATGWWFLEVSPW